MDENSKERSKTKYFELNRIFSAWPVWLILCLVVLVVIAAVTFPPLSQPSYSPVAQATPFFASAPDVISINTAPVEELMLLPGIGEARARDIVAWRESNGAFTSVEQLLEISGIGDKTLENIREYISL